MTELRLNARKGNIMAELNKSVLLNLIQAYGQASREFGRAMLDTRDHYRIVTAEQAANAAFDDVLYELFPLARVQTQTAMERASRELDSATDAQDNVEFGVNDGGDF